MSHSHACGFVSRWGRLAVISLLPILLAWPAVTLHGQGKGQGVYESLKLKPERPVGSSLSLEPGKASEPLGLRYLEVVRARAAGGEVSATAKEVAVYLTSSPIPGTVRAALTPMLERRSPEWLAAKYPAYPSATGDRAGAWKRVFPELVSPDLSHDQKLAALRALVDLFQETPDAREVARLTGLHAPLGLTVRYCAGEGTAAAGREGMKPSVLARLRAVEADAARQGLMATAAAVALNAHLVEHDTLLLPAVTLPQAFEQGGTDGPSGARAQRHGAVLLAQIWPPLTPDSPETDALHQILKTDESLCTLRVMRVLNLQAAAPAAQARAILSRQEAGAPFAVFAGDPPRIRMAGVGDVAVWPDTDSPAIREQRERVREARKRLARIGSEPGFAQRFYNTSSLERELAELRGDAPRLIAPNDSANAARGLASAEANLQRGITRGAYVGQDPTRLDRSLTRDLNAMERGALEANVMQEKSRLEFAQRNDLYNARVTAEYRAREKELVDKINEYNQIIWRSRKDDEAKRKEAQADLAREQARLTELTGGNRTPAQIEAARNPLRWKALAEDRRQRLTALQQKVADTPVEKPNQQVVEQNWLRWWTEPESVQFPRAEIGGLPLPVQP